MVGPTCRVPFLNSLVVSQRKRPYGQSDHVRSVRCELKYESWWPVADDVLGRCRRFPKLPRGDQRNSPVD